MSRKIGWHCTSPGCEILLKGLPEGALEGPSQGVQTGLTRTHARMHARTHTHRHICRLVRCWAQQARAQVGERRQEKKQDRCTPHLPDPRMIRRPMPCGMLLCSFRRAARILGHNPIRQFCAIRWFRFSYFTGRVRSMNGQHCTRQRWHTAHLWTA